LLYRKYRDCLTSFVIARCCVVLGAGVRNDDLPMKTNPEMKRLLIITHKDKYYG
jgi:hypothetical protein